MAAITVGTTETSVTFSVPSKGVIQNLGAGDLYISRSSGVTIANGFKLAANEYYELPTRTGGTVYMIASAVSTDVRYEELG